MGAVVKNAIMEGLRTLVPISALPDDKFKLLAANTKIEELGSGAELFQEGDTDNRAVYLLSGKVLMLSGKSIVDTIVGGSDHARYPLAHHIPRQLTARSKSKVSFVRIDTQMLDSLLTGDYSDSGNSYEVSEMLEDDDDWMIQLLQAKALSNLPPENIQALFMQLEEVPLAAGKDVVREGEHGEYFYLIRTGKCKVISTDKSGKSKVIAELGPGDSFGEEALISGKSRNATVTMLTDGILMRLQQENFDRLMKDPLINWVTYDEASDIVKKGGTWLDVRLPNEYSKVSIAGSKNLPLSVLRHNIERLEKDGTYVTYCDNGTRSSVAAFLLSQRGMEAYVLAGGYKEPDRSPEVEEKKQEKQIDEKPVKEVLDFNKSQIAARKKAEEETARMQQKHSDAEIRAEEEARKRAELEVELSKMRAEQDRVRKQAEEEVNKRLSAEKAVAQMKKEQENAFKKAQEEIERRQQAEAEALLIKAQAEKMLKKAEQEMNKLKAERETVQVQAENELKALQKQREELRTQAFTMGEKLREEAQAARLKAEEENTRLKAEAKAARQKAEEDTARLREEADAARRNAEDEITRLQKEQEQVRKKSEEDAVRLKKEAEEIRRRAEVDARKRSEEMASEIIAEAEATRMQAEQQAEQLMAEAESTRLDAEAENARFLSSMENARLEAEQEVARLHAEAEQVRLAAEEQRRRMSEAEAQRLTAEEESARLRNEAESIRMSAEEEAQRRLSEAESTRLEAEEEATRIKAEAEAARLRAEEEAHRLTAEVEQARMSEQTSDATAMARLEAEAEAARLEAAQAQRLKLEAEERRKQAEQESIRLKVEVEQARQAAEDEARRLIKDAESARKQAEKEAAKISRQAEKAGKKALVEADKLNARADKTRKNAQSNADRIKSEAEEAHKRAEEMIARMRDEATTLRSKVTETTAAAVVEDIEEIVDITEIADIPEIDAAGIHESMSGIADIPELDDDDDDIILLNEAAQDPSSLLVSDDDDMDEISRLIDATAEGADRSGFVIPENLKSQPEKTIPGNLVIAGGAAAAVLLVVVLWLVLGGEEPAAPVTPVADTPVITEPVVSEPVAEQPGVAAVEEKQPVVPEPQAAPPEVASVEEKQPVAVVPEAEPLNIARIDARPEPVKPVIDFKPVSFRDTLSTGGSAPTMMKIPAGSFTMGSGSSSTNFDERPSRSIKMKAYAMGRYEVTVADYKAFLQATGRSVAAFKDKDDKLPASGISWIAAQQYAKWLTQQTGHKYRLPSEAEWEYAARAQADTVFWWGNEINTANANCFDCKSDFDGKLAPVGKFKANLYGLYDMAGNVMEWTQDCANKDYNGAPQDASAWTRGDCTARMVRGGAYNTPSDSLRTRKRNSFAMDAELDNIGLRLVRE